MIRIHSAIFVPITSCFTWLGCQSLAAGVAPNFGGQAGCRPCRGWESAPFRRRCISTSLRGGYDATVSNPNWNIQFYTLLEGGMCPDAARTQIVLRELGLEFDTIEVSGRPKPDWYLNINPRGKVPAIRIPSDDNTVVYESAICDEYLCDYYGSQIRADDGSGESGGPKNLMPASPSERARIRLLNDHSHNVVGPAQFTFLMNKDASRDEELNEALNASLDTYDDALKASGGPFLMGESFTLTDVHFAPFFLRLLVSLRHFKEYEIPGARFTRLLRWHDTCSARESVRAVAPSGERIIEVYNKFVEADYEFGGLNQNRKNK